MSNEHKNFLRKTRINKFFINCCRIGLLLGFLLAWELLAKYEIIDAFIFSSPSRMIAIIGKLYRENNLWVHIYASLYETVMGFIISTFAGTLIAIILWWNKTLRNILEPYVITLNSLPKIALGPIIIVWIGTGKTAIIFMAVLICIIITIISMLAGFINVDAEKIMLLKSMHATKFQIMQKLVLPANIPTLISVLKINVGLSWIGSIMGEYISSKEGLGYLLVYGSQIFQLDLVMASTVILCVLAGSMYAIVALVEKIVHKRFNK